MSQQPTRTRPFVADPNEWEVVDEDEWEAVPPAQTWSDKLGLNEPTASVGTGFLRGAGAGAVDLVQGAVSNITGQLNAKLGADNTARQQASLPQTATLPSVESPDNFSGKVGGALPVIGEMALPGGAPKALSVARNALPDAARAGKNFDKVLGDAKDIIVDVGPAGDRALRLFDLWQKGENLPKPVKDFLAWTTSKKKPPLTYKDSKDFASAMSKLTTAERLKTNPKIRREVALMAAELNLANANAAKAVGRGVEYKAAMREYANAMRMRDAIDGALKHSKKAALAAGLGGAYYMLKD